MGDWNSPSKLNQFDATVKHLHDMYPGHTNGPYKESLINCTKLDCDMNEINSTHDIVSVFKDYMTESAMSLQYLECLKDFMG